jgi:hypothetical protein
MQQSNYIEGKITMHGKSKNIESLPKLNKSSRRDRINLNFH